jgi:uncharacterized repeat protein (TIGR01451 family)
MKRTRVAGGDVRVGGPVPRVRFVGAVVFLGLGLILGLGLPAGAPLLTTPTMDGQFGDWAGVLSNPENRVLDGPGGGLPDADGTSVPGSRDISTVAFTWDATYLYFYIRRQATAPEFNYFWVHFDLDDDGRVAYNAPLLSIGWWGNNRRVDTTLDHYRAANPLAGDAITSPSGSHDGYRLPGTRLPGSFIESLSSGSVNGLEMECRVAWAALGVAAGSPIQFHVSSTKRLNDYPSAINDNAGGTNAFAGVLLDPDRAVTTLPGGPPLVIPHVLTHTGNVRDVFDLSWTSSGAFAPSSLAFHRDVDGSGTLTPGDVLLTDSDGDGLPDSGPMVRGSTMAVLAVVGIPPGVVLGDLCTVTLRARSSRRVGVGDIAIDTITIASPSLTLVKSVDRTEAAPAEVLTYTLVYTNTGGADAHAVEVIDPVPAYATYVAGSAVGAGMSITFSHDGGATWDASDAAPVTHVKWSLGAPLAPASAGTVTLQVRID